MESGQGHRITATTYRLYPNATSERRMLATLEHCRSLYNRLLAECKADAVEDGSTDVGRCVADPPHTLV